MKKLLFTMLMVLAILPISACGVEVVDAGETGVKKTFGKVDTENMYPSGLYFINPFTSSIIKMNNQVQKYEFTTPVYTKDVQKADITYVVNYYLRPTASAKMYIEVGYTYADILIPQVVNGSIKNVIGKWNAIDLVGNRDKASSEIEKQIADILSTRGLVVQKVELTNIDYDQAFEAAVEAKVVAVQRAEEAKNTTVRVKEEAQQRIIAAEADAEAMKIKTTALKESQSLVLYEAVQKWNGVLPKILTGDTGSILNVPTDFSVDK